MVLQLLGTPSQTLGTQLTLQQQWAAACRTQQLEQQQEQGPTACGMQQQLGGSMQQQPLALLVC